MEFSALKKSTKLFCLILAINVLSFSASAQTPDSSRVVRVLSYNILHGATMKGDFDLDLIADVIKSVKPDLVALQEVDFKTNRARKMDLATELGVRTGLAPLFGKAMYFDGGAYGEGVLSRYSFLSTQNHVLFHEPDKEPRAALETNVVLGSGDTIRFVGTHLDHTKDEINRINQAKQLVQLFSQDERPTILAGDLNARPDSDPMKILFQAFFRSFAADTPTFPATDPRIKIDYVLFHPAHRWKVLETKVLDEKVASDHCPVLVVLELQPE